MRFEIGPATTPSEIEQVRTLFQEYQQDIGVDLCFQGFAEELAGLPGEYSPPQGELLLAWVDGQLAGCVALRPLTKQICEMKRLYVRPQFRGLGLGRDLATRIIDEARNRGYVKMRLDTLASMKEAMKLYKSLGFAACEPYRYNPLPEAIYLEKDL